MKWEPNPNSSPRVPHERMDVGGPVSGETAAAKAPGWLATPLVLRFSALIPHYLGFP